MRWLRDNAYLAAWLSPLIALVGMIFRNPKSATGATDWARTIAYIILLTALAAAVTPGLDTTTKTWAGSLVTLGLMLLYFDWKPK